MQTSSPEADPGAEKTKLGSFHRTPRDYIDMFLERWWIGAIVGVVAAALMVVFRPEFEPIYRTEVSLLFETRKDRVLNMSEVVDTSLQAVGELNTHMEQLRSNTFANYVLSSFTPAEIEKIQDAYRDPLKPDNPPPSLASIVRANVSVYARKGSPILGISVRNRSGANAALIANRYARKYIDYNLDRANTGTNSAIVFLRTQAEDMRSQVESAEKAAQDYREKHNLAAIGETKSVTLQKMGSLGTALVGAEVEQVNTKSILDKVEDFQKAKRDLLEIPQIAASGQVATQKTLLSQLMSERTLLEERYLPQHPKIKENALRISETRRLLDESVAKAIADLRASYDVSVRYVERLKAEIADTDKLVSTLDKTTIDYRFLEQDVTTKRSAYTRIIDRLNEANITSQMDNTNIKIFDPAWVPEAPADTGLSDVILRSSGAFLAALLIVPFGIGFLDTRIRTPAHIESSLQENLLGTVKRIPKMSETDRAQIFRLQKDRDISEAYLGIFSEMEVRSTVGFPKMLLITSSLPSEGKSLLSSNLASVFASHKRRTLLIDCDLRRPTLQRYFGVKSEKGWVDWLQTPKDQRAPGPEGLFTVSENLDLLTAGKAPENATSLLDELSKKETLQPFLDKYDIIIFDTPPAAVFPDALMLARCCHEMIYVCRYRTIRVKIVQKVLQRFRSSGISMLGVVLNQLPKSKAQRYGYQGYGTQSAEYYKAYDRSDT